MHVKSVVVALVLAVTLAGCGSDKQSPTPTGNGGNPTSASSGGGGTLPDPCRLITKDEAATAMGNAVQDGVPSNASDGKSCVFSAAVGSVAVMVYSKVDFDAIYSSNKTVYGAKFSDVTGAGDKGFSTPAGVYFRKGSVTVRVQIIGLVDDAIAKTVTLAKAAAARM